MNKKIKINLLTILLFLGFATHNLMAKEELKLIYFNDFKTRHYEKDQNKSNELYLYKISNKWSSQSEANNGDAATGQDSTTFDVIKQPVFYPNPTRIKDEPILMFCTSKTNNKEQDSYEVRFYNTRGYEIHKKVFTSGSNNITYLDANFADYRYVNLAFSESELAGKFSAGGYLFVLLRNNKYIAKGKLAIKP